MNPCKYRKSDGMCEKYKIRRKCAEPLIPTFDGIAVILDRDEVCEHSSIFGNHYIALSEDHIQALKDGKAVAAIDEYGVFLALEKPGEEGGV